MCVGAYGEVFVAWVDGDEGVDLDVGGGDLVVLVWGVFYGVVVGVGADELVGDCGDLFVGDGGAGGGGAVVVGWECGEWGDG